MPKKPLRHCAFQGCNKFVSDAKTTYCDEHKKLYYKEYDKFERKYNHKDRYDSKWSKLRDKYIKMHPLCEECLREGKSTLARIVHHKVPIENGGSILDIDNLESVCDSCHQKLHKRQGG